jgi:hypothetical protein
MCYSLGCPGGLILDMGYHVLSALAMYLGALSQALALCFWLPLPGNDAQRAGG